MLFAFYFFEMTPTIENSQMALANIAQILRTGRPFDSQFNFREIVLSGRDPEAVKRMLEEMLHPDYKFIDVVDGKIPDEPRLVLVKDQSLFESPYGKRHNQMGLYDFTLFRIMAVMSTRKDSRLLTLLPGQRDVLDRYDSPFPYYAVLTDRLDIGRQQPQA